MPLYPTNFYSNITDLVPTQQYQGRSGSAVGGSFEIGRSTWTEQWQVTYQNIQTLVESVLGWGKVGGSANVIQRHLPAYSAAFPFMRATAIPNIEALAPTGIGPMQEAAFKEYRATIQFETLPYNLATDAEVTSQGGAGTPPESLRYVVWNCQPAAEFARTPFNVYKYPLGTGSANAGKRLPGQNGQAVLLTKYRITATWMQVPEAWVTTDATTFPNLDNAIGTVNQGEFLGYPAGTMLFESYEPTPRVMPVLAATLGVTDPNYIPRCYDITMKWLLFDPKPFFMPGGIEDNAPRGHNLVFDPVAGQWQRALLYNTNTDANGNWLYRESDHDKIFKGI